MNRTEGIVRISVSLPERLLAQLDQRVDREGYPSRSELLRDLIRGQLVTEKWEGDAEEVIGVLTISYDHHRRELAERVMTIQHERFVNVLCSTHVHLDEHECLEVIILRGRPREVERMSGEIGSLKGVKLARLTRACRVEA